MFVIISRQLTHWGHFQQIPLHRNPEWLVLIKRYVSYVAAKGGRESGYQVKIVRWCMNYTIALLNHGSSVIGRDPYPAHNY